MDVQSMYYNKLLDEIKENFVCSDFYLKHQLMDVSSVVDIVYDMEDFGETGLSWFNQGLYKMEIKIKVGYNKYKLCYDYSFLKYTLYCSDSFVFNCYRSLTTDFSGQIRFIITNSDLNYKSEVDTDTIIKFLFSSGVSIECDIFPGKKLRMYESLYFEFVKNINILSRLDYAKNHHIMIRQMGKSKIIITTNISNLIELYGDFDMILLNLNKICNSIRNILYGDKEIEISIYSFDFSDTDLKDFIKYLISNNNYTFKDISLSLKTSVRLSDSYKRSLINSFNEEKIFKTVNIKDFNF